MRKIKAKAIITFIVVLLIVIATGGVQYYLWNEHVSKIEADYTEQIEDLEATLHAIGPLSTVFTVREEVFAGQEIFQENLTTVQMPSSLVGEAYVLDPATVIGKYYKVAITPNTPITNDLVMDDEIDDTMREIDITANTWPIGLKVGDYIDFEIVYPLGEQYTVLSRVHVLGINATTIKVKINGLQRHKYQAALIDYILNARKGATLNMTKYIEPGIQKAAIPYYAIPNNIVSIITADPNIINKVEVELNARTRQIVEGGLDAVAEQIGGIIAAGRLDLINKSDAASKEFWSKEKEKEEKERVDQLLEQPTESEIKIEDEVIE